MDHSFGFGDLSFLASRWQELYYSSRRLHLKNVGKVLAIGTSVGRVILHDIDTGKAIYATSEEGKAVEHLLWKELPGKRKDIIFSSEIASQLPQLHQNLASALLTGSQFSMLLVGFSDKAVSL